MQSHTLTLIITLVLTLTLILKMFLKFKIFKIFDWSELV